MNWMLLRGLAREQRHWGGFPEALAARRGGGKVHCLDLPGMGTEHARAGRAEMDGIVSDLRRRWLELRTGHPGRWRLCGISLGGMAALRWVATHPEDFTAVVVINSSAGDLSPPWHRMVPAAVGQVMRALVERDPVARERRVLAATTRIRRDLDPVAAAYARFQEESPVTRPAVLLQLLAAARFRAPRTLALPSLFVVGARDPLTNPECSRRLAARYHAPLAIHPEAGHDLSLDDPEWLAERVAAFPG